MTRRKASSLGLVALWLLVGGLLVLPAFASATPSAPTVGGGSVSNVGSASARLSAQVNPEGSLTTYRFEYGTGVEYGSATPPATLGPGTTTVPVIGEVGELQPDTLYHFRVVASNAQGEGRGPDATFSTFPVGPLGLPDGRGYEMVTPVANENSNVYEPTIEHGWNFQGGTGDNTRFPFQAAAGGGAIAYVATPSVGGNGSTGDQSGNEYVAKRSPSGSWSVANIQPPGLETPVYQAFSNDLSVAFLDSSEALAPSAPGGGYTVPYSSETANSVYAPLFTVTPPNRAPSNFGAFGVVSDLKGHVPHPAVYAGASEDLSHLLFEANDALTVEAVDGGPEANNLYDAVDGIVRSVNVLPDGSPEANATFGGLGTNTPAFSHVISNDGSRIFWTDLNTHVLYVREDGTSTVQVDAAQAGAPGPGGGGQFWTASSDGSRVFFTDENRLTSDSTAALGEPDLYEYDLATGDLVDLTVETAGVEANVGEHANVQGLLGASEDGSYVYFVAEGVLAEGATSQPFCQRRTGGGTTEYGSCNLYVLHSGEPVKFIAALSGKDNNGPEAGFEGGGDWQPALDTRSAQVTPDGQHLAFLSAQSLTGYDNRGLPEAFVYEARSGALSCASCAPRGVPPATPKTAYLAASWSDTRQTRFLSDDGDRLFFDTKEALVPQDTNGEVDAYEWEQNGTGSCGRAGGCIYLLSGGTSTDGSFFLDASANGDEAFIMTRAQLVPQDENEADDLYDVRVGAPAVVSPATCTGTGCQGPPAAPPIFSTPPSVTFNGLGNFPSPAATSPPVKRKVPTRAELLVKALRACRKDKGKKTRRACEKSAHRRYGVNKAKKADTGRRASR
ncbi:MAG TPA: fibronectin type III domain-containing protein [Solirubrobacteraceae bacterium]|nr:fibronectin type III domain-containing protein [Solirubrobacteraceae bacterium]